MFVSKHLLNILLHLLNILLYTKQCGRSSEILLKKKKKLSPSVWYLGQGVGNGREISKIIFFIIEGAT